LIYWPIEFLAICISYFFKWINFNYINYIRERILKIIPISLLYSLSFFAFQTFGLQYTSSAEGGILLSASPIFTLILATYFLKEKTTFLQKISILISVSGVIYITVNKTSNLEFNNIKGTLLLILAALSISGYSVMARKLTKGFSSLSLAP
jgi:drug/metabolite transporter (DMT)-like permease